MLNVVIKVIAIVLAVVLVMGIGYTIVNSVIQLFNGKTVGEALADSWYNLTHLFGLIKDAAAEKIEVIEYPMANKNITWETHVAAHS